MIEAVTLLDSSRLGWLFLPLMAGIGTALLAAPLGCFVIWQRMAYFGESLAHSALLGVALGLWLNITSTLAVLVSGVLMAFLLAYLRRNSRFSNDTLLGILSHTLLAGGLVLLSTLPNLRVSLDSLLFGDLLAVSAADTLVIYSLLIALVVLLMRLWRPLITMTVHEELAKAEGVAVDKIRTLLMLMMALVVAAAMKVVGVLLMTSLLIIPAAIAHRYARSPEQMAVLACISGVLAVCGGIVLSWYTNSPVGPSIVLLAGLFFLSTMVIDLVHKGRYHLKLNR